MRPLALTLVVAALGVGGVAVAQPQLVVDPWGSANADADSWFGQAEKEASAVPTADPGLVDPWQPVREPEPRAKRVEVFPAAPETNASPKNVSRLPAPAPLLIDPWAPVVASDIPSLSNDRGPRAGEQQSAWSGRMIEVVDPWTGASDAATKNPIRLIVDPWAR